MLVCVSVVRLRPAVPAVHTGDARIGGTSFPSLRHAATRAGGPSEEGGQWGPARAAAEGGPGLQPIPTPGPALDLLVHLQPPVRLAPQGPGPLSPEQRPGHLRRRGVAALSMGEEGPGITRRDAISAGLGAAAAVGAQAGAQSAYGAQAGARDASTPPLACAELLPAPDTVRGFDAFVAETAVALARGDRAGGSQLDLSPVVAASRRAKVVMLGEIHGSREIGELSVELLREMLRTSRVDAVALEIQMDLRDALAEYVATGGGAIETTYAMSAWDKNAYYDLVVEARRQAAQGRPIEAVGLDVPLNLGWVHDQITAIAATAGRDDVRKMITGPLPERLPYDPFAPRVPPGYIGAAAAYVEELAERRQAICGAFEPSTCDHLFALVDALELGARRAAGGQKQGNYYGRREALMAHNMKRILYSGGEKRVLAHLGAYHAGKTGSTLAKRLASDERLGDAGVYTLSMSFGGGSVLKYGARVVRAGPSSDGLSDALGALPSDRYLVSTRDPSAQCVANPIAGKPMPSGQGGTPSTFGEAYDAVLWYRQLTPFP